MKRFLYILWVAAALLSVGPLWAQGIEDTPLPPDTTTSPIITPTPLPRPQPVRVNDENGLHVEQYFDVLPQGQVGLLHVTAANLSSARARLFDKSIEGFPIEGDGYYILLSAGMEQNPRNNYDLDVFATTSDNQQLHLTVPLAVTTGQFIRQDITMAPDRAYLVDAEIERAEMARLESIFSQRTEEHLWDANGFQRPILNADLTSPFGAFRNFNDVLQARHTGWDIRTTLGVPLMASASGRVAFTGRMDIRGNFVAIDHGYGIFSTYSHLSQIHVTRGQDVVKGQIIGVTGDTGRSSGPHFHWEMAVNGEFVDSVQFTETWLP